MTFRVAPGAAIASIAVLAVAAFLISWKYYSRMNPYESLMPSTEASVLVPIYLHNVDVRTRSIGANQWQVHADTLKISPDRRSIDASNLNSGIIYQSGRPAARFKALDVKYQTSQFALRPNVHISGGVEIQTTANPGTSGSLPIHVSTDAVTWDGSTGTLLCPAPVAFRAANLGSGQAGGFHVDLVKRIVSFASINLSTSVTNQTTAGQAVASATPTPSAATEQNENLLTYVSTAGGYWDENNRVLTLRGLVTFHQGQAEVDMNGATYDRKTDVATSSSPVTITATDTTVTGNHGSVDFSKHVAILSGNIVMKVLPKPQDTIKEQEAKKPTTIACDQVNYNYRTKQAQTTGAVVIKQPGRTVTAADGQYDVTLKVVTLTGNVVGKSDDGKVIKAPLAKVSVDPDDEWIDLTGPVTGQFPVADSDNLLSPNSKPAPATPHTTDADKATSPTTATNN